MKKFIFVILFCILNSTLGFCYEPKEVFGAWTVFETVQNNKTLCYIMNIPETKKSNYINRGEPFFMIIKEYGKKQAEINTSVGYIIDDKVNAIELKIDRNTFPLLNYQDKAWAYNIDDDKHIIEFLMKFDKFDIYGNSKNGKYSVDTYSSAGLKEAYDNIMQSCK